MPHVGEPFRECEFEITPFATEVRGRIRATVFESGGEHPTGIIRENQDWYVRVDWQLQGSLLHHLCGTFCVALHIECMGAGPERTLGQQRIEMDPCGDGRYTSYIRVPAGTISGGDCGRVCCLYVTLTSFDACGDPGHMAAYCEGPCIMFAAATHAD